MKFVTPVHLSVCSVQSNREPLERFLPKFKLGNFTKYFWSVKFCLKSDEKKKCSL